MPDGQETVQSGAPVQLFSFNLYNPSRVQATTPPSFQDPVCLVCGGTDTRQRFVQRGYVVMRCSGCGLEFVDPTPSPAELAEYYDQSYAVPLERYAAAGERNRARIADLERWSPARGRLLEIGASYGHSLALARERGWEVVGVELSPTASAHAREHFGLTVFNCDLADVPLPDASIDAAIGWHVLEHVRDPKDHLLRLAGLLKPGGILGLRVPNVASFGARVAGQWWPWMCPPAHLWFFSPTTLPRLVAACGFEVEEIRMLRGDGNNLYQYALMAAGARLNDLRVLLRGSSDSRREVPTNAVRGSSPESPPEPNMSDAVPQAGTAAIPKEPSHLLQRWLDLLERAQPLTDSLARGTRPLLEAIERRGWGDELLVYARRRG